MSDPVKKVIRKVRRTFLPPQQDPPSAFEIQLADWKSIREKKDMWTRDKVIKRDISFAKAVQIRSLNIEIRRKEREAQELREQEIYDARIKNLRKARRVLKKSRSIDDE